MLNKRLLRFVSLGCFLCLIQCGDSTHSAKNHAEFSFWTVGSSGISARFGEKIYDSLDNLRGNTGQLDEFLFTIAEEPLTKDQIQERSSLSQAQVEYFVTNLESCRFVKKFDQNRWATTLPVITDNQMKIIRKDLAPMADSVAQYLMREIPQLKSLYDEAKSPTDPNWENISHLIIDKFIIDGKFHSHFNRLKREDDVSKRDNGKVSVIPAFLLHRGENFSTFGCNWYGFNEDDDQREVYLLHGAVLDRYEYRMNKYRGDKNFSAGLFKISPDGGIDSLTDREKEMLRDLDWLSGDRLLVPVIKADTIRRLLPAMENIGRYAAEVAFAKFADMTDSYNKSAYSQFLDYKEDYIQVLIHSLFGLTVEQLVGSGSVSQVPETVPESFGVYIVIGNVF